MSTDPVARANRDTGEKVITAQNVFTDEVVLKTGTADISVSASTPGAGITATVTLQRKWLQIDGTADNGFKDTGNYVNVEDEDVATISSPGIYRLGVKTGDYSSGTIHCRIRQG